MIFINAGHVPCHRIWYVKNAIKISLSWFTIRGLVLVSARQFNEKTKTIN